MSLGKSIRSLRWGFGEGQVLICVLTHRPAKLIGLFLLALTLSALLQAHSSLMIKPMTMLDANCRSVLIADDSDDIRSFLRALMESKGFTVIEAPDGEKAVEVVRQKCPDLIVLDLNMPKLDGLGAAKRIRAIKGHCEDVPIVALTGFDSDKIKHAARNAGFSDYVAKPIDQGEMEPVLRRLFPLSF
jgi:CheY-like chemotaxis protein